ncbi:type I phosphomannose isomerase catalytic subunit, partial [Mycobacterium kansasii]
MNFLHSSCQKRLTKKVRGDAFMPAPLLLQPVFHEKIWGGSQLRSRFNYPIFSDHTGECWGISGHPHGLSTIKNGRYQ